MINIHKAVLYKTGIGYFERKGTIKGNKLKLNFKSGTMNDILATLTIFTTKSQVAGISYEGYDIDFEKVVQDSLIKIPETNSFTSLLTQLIGVNVSFNVGSKIYEGIILGIQTFPKGEQKKIINDTNIVLKLKKGNIQNISLSDITALKILDDKFQSELKFFIEKIYEGKKKDNKIITIHFENVPPEGDEVIISYLQENPSWKSSYRLVVTEAKDKFMIQGWSLIDNVQDEDWKDIKLSLVAGLPISFIYDLYSPNLIQRPKVARKDRYDMNVVSYEETDGDYQDMPTTGAPMNGIMGFGAGRSEPVKQVKRSSEEKAKSVQVQSVGEGAGDYFQYKITVPVTVERNQSSLVPILQNYVKGKRISVYNEKVRKINPAACLDLENTSSFTLEEGPISIFEGDRFIGEAMLPFMKDGEKRIISYAIDLGVVVSNKSKTTSEKISELYLSKYGIYEYHYEIREAEYDVKNKTQDDEREVIIEHPILQGYDLYDTKEPDEKTKNFYRYKLKVEPKAGVKLLVKTRRKISSTRSYDYINQSYIDELLKLKLLNQKERDLLVKLLELETLRKENADKIAKLQEEIQIIHQDQDRLRENVKSLGTSSSESKLRERYISKLENQEEKLDRIQAEINDLEKKNLALREDFTKIVNQQKE
ncbi:MAG: hypothetical protein EAX96_17455 [Candidatus Lokiarchaeota archaeon]|nr:hypothetical protein [Candidatus Lokiarchaeota archaeon]